MKRLKDSVAVVTGAGSGIGRALALELASQGCHLALSDINDVNLGKTRELCKRYGTKVSVYDLDVSDRAAVFQHAEEVASDFGHVNLIINNAGVTLSAKDQETDIEDFEWLMGINFWGVVYGSQAFLPMLIKSGDGHIINISSIFGLITVPKQAAYSSAKFAVRGYTESLRQELVLDEHPVQVSCVHPGFIATDIARNGRLGHSEDAESTILSFDKATRTSPEKAARTIVRGIQRNKSRILIGPDAYAVEVLHRLLGAQYQKITQFIARKLMY